MNFCGARNKLVKAAPQLQSTIEDDATIFEAFRLSEEVTAIGV